MKDFIENKILPKVNKPARYQGNEWNSIHKDWDGTQVKMVFAFPDVYEVGMSHLGLKILYHIVNKRDDTLMERVFAPWVDFESEIRKHKIPLFALESYKPLSEFDIIAFTLQYEMSFTNILNMLDLAGLPLRAEKRGNKCPLIIAGGPAAYNPEPLAPFIDAFVIGEGEEVIHEVIDVVKGWKLAGDNLDRKDLLKRMVKIAGVYVPEFYDVKYNSDGTINQVVSNSYAPNRIAKRVIKKLEDVDFPTKPIVPFIETVHDRIMLEVFRGCSRGCRFCQAGMIYRPVREKKPETILKQADELVKSTGYDEISLTSLSTSDYSCVEDVLKTLTDRYGSLGIGISLPSLRADSFSVELAKQVQKVRKTSLTFAPEAGTQRLRDVINKGVNEHNLIEATEAAFKAGWSAVKLYFMIGLPTEKLEDLDGIADMAKKVVELGYNILGSRAGRLRVTVSASSFVPKAHTPFQWFGQDTVETLLEKQRYLGRKLKHKKIVFNWHDSKLSFIEAVFARGSRKVGDALERAWQLGCKFDSWSEHFKYEKWLQAFSDVGIDPAFYANRNFDIDEVLPWDHIDAGVSKKFLALEYKQALSGQTTTDCRFGRCSVCGVCPSLSVQVDVRKK